MFYNNLSKRTVGLASLYKSEEQIGLEAIQIMENESISKGRKAEPIGSKKTWGGIDYVKTASGWSASKKVKAAHEAIHGSGELHPEAKKHFDEHVDKYSKMDDTNKKKYVGIVNAVNEVGSKMEGTQTEDSKHRHAANAKFLDHVKGEKKDAHGIEVGKEYDHAEMGKVKVTKVEKNTGDKADRIPHHVTFTHSMGEDTQGIGGFKDSVKAGADKKNKVIGKTSSGKDVHNDSSHPDHKDFSFDDHIEAANHHIAERNKVKDSIIKKHGENKQAIVDEMNVHSDIQHHDKHLQEHLDRARENKK